MTAKQLRRRLEALSLNQVEASRRLGVDPRTVRRWVLGESSVPNPVALLLEVWLRERRPHGKP